MPSDERVSDCPECGVGVKAELRPDHDLSLSELSVEDVRKGEYFFCPMCQVGWDVEDRMPHDVPSMSSDSNGLLSEVTTGQAVSNRKTSNFRLLGYSDNGHLMLRDVGDLAFARDNSPGPTHPEKLENQLGDVIEVLGLGYPEAIQNILNALRPGYCIHATIGESETGETLVIDASNPCSIAEAVPIDYAIETEFVPEFADEIWDKEFDEIQSGGPIPHTRRTLHAEGGPAADVYVFPKAVQNEQGIPLLACIQRGITHHLEKFTTNFTGVFNGGVIDVLFIAPKDRPYFAVYCLGGDCLDLAHRLRTELELSPVHQGWEADRTRIFDIRYNPQYVERAPGRDDILLPVTGDDAEIDIESGTVDGDYFETQFEPHEVVVTVSDEGRTVEVARLRAPSVRVGATSVDDSDSLEREPSQEGSVSRSPTEQSSNSDDYDGPVTLSEEARQRLADIVALQPTSNGELADVWGLKTGKNAYQYISSHLDEFYYRDSESRIRATERAEELVSDR